MEEGAKTPSPNEAPAASRRPRPRRRPFRTSGVRRLSRFARRIGRRGCSSRWCCRPRRRADTSGWRGWASGVLQLGEQYPEIEHGIANAGSGCLLVPAAGPRKVRRVLVVGKQHPETKRGGGQPRVSDLPRRCDGDGDVRSVLRCLAPHSRKIRGWGAEGGFVRRLRPRGSRKGAWSCSQRVVSDATQPDPSGGVRAALMASAVCWSVASRSLAGDEHGDPDWPRVGCTRIPGHPQFFTIDRVQIYRRRAQRLGHLPRTDLPRPRCRGLIET